MTARSLASAQSISLAAPVTVESRFDLRFVNGSNNPLPRGGMLAISGEAETVERLEAGTTVHATSPFSVALERVPVFSVLIESDGHRLLALDLQVTRVVKNVSDRVEVRVTSRGILPEHAVCLGIATGAYDWRLTGEATRSGERLRLTFGLAQELVVTRARVAALNSIRLPFEAGPCDEPKHARIKIPIKTSGTGLQVPTA